MKAALLAMLLATAQDGSLLTPAEIVLPLDREARIASIERTHFGWTRSPVPLSPAMRRLIVTHMADESYRAERINLEREALLVAAEQAARRMPMDALAYAAALEKLATFDRSHSSDKNELTARIIRAAPAAERGAVARHFARWSAADTGADTLDEAADSD